MESIKTLMTKPRNDSPTPATQKPQRIFSPEEKENTAYFFYRLSIIYQAEYYRQMPSKQAESDAKRDNCIEVGKYSREQINKACEWIKAQHATAENYWGVLNVSRCVAAIKEANTVKACHKIFDKSKALPELPASKDFSRSELQKLKGIVT